MCRIKKFKVGDDVISHLGSGVVTEIIEGEICPIFVKMNESNRIIAFTSDGKCCSSDIFPTLFHADEKPKQWVTKRKVKVVQWGNVYERVTHIHNTESAARKYAQPEAIAVAVKLTGEYEVVE